MLSLNMLNSYNLGSIVHEIYLVFICFETLSAFNLIAKEMLRLSKDKDHFLYMLLIRNKVQNTKKEMQSLWE